MIDLSGTIIIGGSCDGLFPGHGNLHQSLQITYFLAIMIAGLGISYAIHAFREQTMPAFLKASGVLLIAAMVGVGPNIAKHLDHLRIRIRNYPG